MNTFALKTLEYGKVQDQLIAFTVSDSGRKLAEKHVPSSDYRRVAALMTETEEALKLLQAGASIPLSAMDGIEPFFALLGKGVIFSESDLSHLASWLSAVAQMKRYMASKAFMAPTISAYASSLHDCPELREELERCLRYGKLTDNASSELAKIRRQLAVQEDRIKRRLEQSTGKFKAYLQESLISKRNGHYVIAVRREYRKMVPGTVWDESSSGQTLFIEPSDVAGVQAEWEMGKADERREESVLLAILSQMAEEAGDDLKLNLEAMASFDFIFARGKLASAMGGHSVSLVPDARIKLVGARHPLLGKDAVALHAEIGGEFRQLVITGPNTGGKTVALKTIGLTALMVQSGLLVPVLEGSTFGLFNSILADVGDGQSLEQSLSTFSGHITSIKEMMNMADHRSLLLLDELAAGTDPGEGIALSLAILEELLERGSLTVATTHFNEIKNFAARTPGCQNARMAFDPDSLQPLYRLEIGEAGESFALAIARKYGMPEKVVRRAEERLRVKEMDITRTSGMDNEESLSPYPSEKRHKAAQAAGSNSKADDREHVNTQEDTAKRPLQKGDAVWVYPLRRTGIVYMPANERGEVVVQVQQRKLTFNRKRLSLRITREQLYPSDDYDLDIVFESVENRKARKLMSRKYDKDIQIVTRPEEEF